MKKLLSDAKSASDQPMELASYYDLRLPGGKRLGDATMKDLEEAAKWYEQEAAKHRPGCDSSRG